MKHPTVNEVSTYWDETKLLGDPAEFFDHFEANGWIVGRVAMKNWQAAARNWSRNEIKYGKGGDLRIVRKSPEVSSREAEVAAELAEERRQWQERHK